MYKRNIYANSFFLLKESAQKLPRVDAAVFLLNNLHPLRSTLSLYQSDDKRLVELNKRMEGCLEELVKEQTAYILQNLELSPILSIMSKVSDFGTTAIDQ